MKTSLPRFGMIILAHFLLFDVVSSHAQAPQGTAFTYQGQLLQNGTPVNSTVDLVFDLFDTPTGGTRIGPSLSFTAATSNPVQVQNGIFTVALDFGALAFNSLANDERYLRVTVNGNALSPRTKIENAPYALHARSAELAYSVSNASVGISQINTAQVQARIGGACAVGEYVRGINADGSVVCSRCLRARITASDQRRRDNTLPLQSAVMACQ